ncbi:hypothetical protein V7S43_002390 [Phytophthora oleae]|uniref:Uncharacterized protein n=1 Tax=Phytophthora oleae TaxID=2107226 RepID=A0ABD3G1S9_9STRA
MTRVAAWNTCNRLDDRLRESQWQAHRDRVAFIQSASSVSAQACSSALAASAHPRRLHKSWNSSSPVKLIARSKSPAAKSRQKQIEHDNLVLIKKIIALDNVKATPRCGSKAKKKRKPTQRYSSTTVSSTARSSERNAILIPKQAHSDHECLRTLADVPQSASHALYTRSSATMKNNFVEYNAPTMLHSSNSTSAAARVRSRAQSKILDENKKILQRILSARTTVDRSELERHGERHSKLRTIMSRHNSTSKLPQKGQDRPLRTSRSQMSLHRDSSDSVIRTDSVSHLAQPKSRPRSASQACKSHTARRSESSESLVSRIRKMTMESQCESK